MPTSTSRWSTERAWEWYHKTGAIRGCNYLPRTAVNSTEMWQAETFDPKTIVEELGWAQNAGYNGLRVFLQYVVWRADPDGLKARISEFLDIAGRHGMRVMPVPFCDCSFAGKEPYLGRQDDPVPGVHNSGWVPSPGLKRVTDREAWPDLERYIKDIVGAFADDPRVLAWDLYNEPGNSNMGEKSLPLKPRKASARPGSRPTTPWRGALRLAPPMMEAAFAWTREARPSQPLTVGLWSDFKSKMSQRMVDLSDVISFHAYDAPEGVKAKIRLLEPNGRPLLCTEWLRRQGGNTFAAILPIFAEHKVGWYNWGLVAGKTQTYMPWGSKKGDPMPQVWQHDIFHPDGTPYHAKEILLIRKWE